MANRHALGLFGGTFDPVHNGHLQMAEAALAALPLAELRLLPCGLPPHRETPQASAGHRLAMLKLAIAGRPGLAVDERELHRGGISYTVDTLESLRAEHGLSRPLILLLGSDAFAGLTTWKDWRQLPVLAHLVVLARPGWQVQLPTGLPVQPVSDPAALAAAPAGGLYCLPNAPVPLSATAVRTALAAGDALSDRVPAEVLAYIENHRLYR